VIKKATILIEEPIAVLAGQRVLGRYAAASSVT
jgi:hypothetical protein